MMESTVGMIGNIHRLVEAVVPLGDHRLRTDEDSAQNLTDAAAGPLKAIELVRASNHVVFVSEIGLVIHLVRS